MTLSCEIPLDPGREIDFEAIPNVPGVFLIWPREGAPYIGRTSLLRRRLSRLLRPREKQSRLLNLAGVAERVEYQATGSPFESLVLLYRVARRFRPEDYSKFLKLRIPPFLKVNLVNPYPRCYITRRLGRDRALYFGPFSSRAAVEHFQGTFLDLFLMRRCREEIVPDPAHPGCIYGEMHMCLRPCQAASTEEQYRGEVGRVVEFLSSRGESLLKQLESERERASEGLEFEQAARVHKRLEKTQEALKLVGTGNEELARDLDHFYGAVIQRSVDPQAVELWFLHQGYLQARQRLTFAVEEGRPISLDQKLRETIAGMRFKRRSSTERAEHLALVTRWHGSSWKEGELLLFDGLDQAPYRKLVRAISRVAAGASLGSNS
ncbi:MAG: UvrB/UvrC motif-containing protein [Acidobacteria bacterium]|nr:UvrB/UvrC motif-containing protein [Acidobacteriota bacterium]